jgi:hypothetical protein
MMGNDFNTILSSMDISSRPKTKTKTQQTKIQDAP